jgi:hypothetical protein
VANGGTPRMVLLILSEPEADFTHRAIERYPQHNGGGEPALRQSILERLESERARFTERELGELARMGDGR